MPSPCSNTSTNLHDWECVGTCTHTSPEARSRTQHEAYRCRACGRVAHSLPYGYVRELAAQSPEAWQQLLLQEHTSCPIWQEMETQVAQVTQLLVTDEAVQLVRAC